MTKKYLKDFKHKKSKKRKAILPDFKKDSKGKNDTNNKYICEECKISFSLFKNLLRHKNEQHEKKNFKRCPYCLKDIPRYKEHIQRCKKCIYDDIISSFENPDENRTLNDKKQQLSKNLFFEFSTYKAFDVKIGEGSFGKVFYGINHKNSFPLALKFFKNNNYDFYLFKREIDYITIFKDQKFFPKIYYYEFSDNKKIIVQTLLGPNLRKLADLCGGKLPLYTILSIGIELLKRIEIVHSFGIIHGDIKPSNILYGNFTVNKVEQKDSLYIIDYGLSRKYLTTKNMHIEYTRVEKISGTYEYCSRHAINHERISRRDDIESILYTLIRLYRGELPWTKYSREFTGDLEIEKIRECNFNCEPKSLFKGMPSIFEFIYKNIQTLKFDEKPPYDIYITLFQKEKIKILQKNNIAKYKFIWIDIVKEAFGKKNKNNTFLQTEIRKIFFFLEKEVLIKYFQDIQKEDIYSIVK